MSTPPKIETAAPACGACEAELRRFEGRWVCFNVACPLFGREQLAAPDAPPGDKAQRPGGMTR